MCVRKRPLGPREERRGEVNIITVKDKETLLLHEKKEAVDLTQYILQVTCSTWTLCFWASHLHGWDKENCIWGSHHGKQRRAVCISWSEIGGGLFWELSITVFELHKTCVQNFKPQNHAPCSLPCTWQDKTLCYMSLLQKNCLLQNLLIPFQGTSMRSSLPTISVLCSHTLIPSLPLFSNAFEN